MLFRSKSQLDKVLGFDGAVSAPKTKAEDVVLTRESVEETPFDTSNSSEDEDLDYFKSLANQE